MNKINTEGDSYTPVENITDRELDTIILKMGSFLSVLQNKKVNQAKLLIVTIKDPIFQKCFLLLSDIDNLQLLVQNIICKYPTLCKSKVVTSALINKRGLNKYRKNSL